VISNHPPLAITLSLYMSGVTVQDAFGGKLEAENLFVKVGNLGPSGNAGKSTICLCFERLPASY
jgi:hypothetical protein